MREYITKAGTYAGTVVEAAMRRTVYGDHPYLNLVIHTPAGCANAKLFLSGVTVGGIDRLRMSQFRLKDVFGYEGPIEDAPEALLGCECRISVEIVTRDGEPRVNIKYLLPPDRDSIRPPEGLVSVAPAGEPRFYATDEGTLVDSKTCEPLSFEEVLDLLNLAASKGAL